MVVNMNSARRHVARTLLLIATLSVSLTAPAAPTGHGRQPAAPDDQPLAGMRPEGRLRKLHLVRPDLIPYPIAYEVYC